MNQFKSFKKWYLNYTHALSLVCTRCGPSASFGGNLGFQSVFGSNICRKKETTFFVNKIIYSSGIAFYYGNGTSH